MGMIGTLIFLAVTLLSTTEGHFIKSTVNTCKVLCSLFKVSEIKTFCTGWRNLWVWICNWNWSVSTTASAYDYQSNCWDWVWIKWVCCLNILSLNNITIPIISMCGYYIHAVYWAWLFSSSALLGRTNPLSMLLLCKYYNFGDTQSHRYHPKCLKSVSLDVRRAKYALAQTDWAVNDDKTHAVNNFVTNCFSCTLCVYTF